MDDFRQQVEQMSWLYEQAADSCIGRIARITHGDEFQARRARLRSRRCVARATHIEHVGLCYARRQDHRRRHKHRAQVVQVLPLSPSVGDEANGTDAEQDEGGGFRDGGQVKGENGPVTRPAVQPQIAAIGGHPIQG